MVGVTTFYLLLLICLQSFILGTNAAVPTKSENLHNHDFKSQTDSQLTDKTESDTATQKSCRFRWKWESIVYGDICLPAKSSLIKRQKTSSIRRHRHRHKNRDYNDEPVTLTRHLNLYREGEAGIAPLLPTGDTGVYQMDAPRYAMKTVSSF